MRFDLRSHAFLSHGRLVREFIATIKDEKMTYFLKLLQKKSPTKNGLGSLLCLGAFTAGCLFSGTVDAQTINAKTVDANQAQQIQSSNLNQLLSGAPSINASPLRDGKVPAQTNGVVQAGGANANQLVPRENATIVSWNAPLTPEEPLLTPIQVAPINRPVYRPPTIAAPGQQPTAQSSASFRPIASATTPAVQQPTSVPVSTKVAPEIPSAAKLPGVYNIQNIELREFETKIISAWGDRLVTSASSDGRLVKVQIPTKVIQRMQMTIDRKSKTVTYEGDKSLMDNWRRLMVTLDSPPSAVGTAEAQAIVIAPRGASAQTVQNVAYLMGMTQEQDDVQNGIKLPANMTPEQLEQVRQQAKGLKGKVTIVEDVQTGALTLIGLPEDLQTLKAVIDDINSQSSDKQPLTKRIPLKNLQSEAIAEQIQTLYDNGFAPTNGDAQIIPLTSPNAIIVIAQPEGVASVEKIVAEMDVEGAAGEMGDFKTFRLKYISSADAKDRLDTYFSLANIGQGDNTLPSAPVNVIADYRSNSVTIKGAKQFIQQAEEFLKGIDVIDAPAANVVKIFPIKNTLAEELAIVIQDAINGQQPNAGFGYNPNQGAQALRNQTGQNQINPLQSNIRSPGLTLQTIDKSGRMVTSGIMFDVRVTADRNSNSLVVTGPAESMALIGELIEQLDRLPNAETQIKVFEIVNGDAQALLDMLEALFGSDANAGFGGGGGAQTNSNLSQLPLQGASSTDGQTLVNLRFSVDLRTNTIIASGPAGDLQVVEDLLNRLDATDLRKATTKVYRLSNAPALDIAEALTEWLDARSDIINNDPRTSSGVGPSNLAINVVAEVVSNSLIVTARPEYREEIEGIIKALDRRPPMVKVKVLIAEVNLNTLEEFGVELGIQDSLLFDRSTILDAANVIQAGTGFGFNQNVQNNLVARSPNNVAGQALSNLGIGRINNDLGYGGLVLSGGSESVSVLMRALKDRQCLRVLSKPHIMTMENLQGRISIGSEVPRVAGTTSTNFGITQEVQFVDVGVILEVTPRVSPDGLIVMAVNAKRSSVGGDETGITIGFGQNGEPIIAPQIIETEANTTLMARSGQTVVFSGLIQEEKGHSERGAPILSDLPLIGPLFKFESDSASRSELLIIMTPFLVTDEQDIATQNQDETERMHWCECDVADVYGTTEYGRHMSTEQPIETYRPFTDPAGDQPQAIQIDAPQPVFETGARSEKAGQTKSQVRRASFSRELRK
jgi:type II secretion system protein D